MTSIQTDAGNLSLLKYMTRATSLLVLTSILLGVTSCQHGIDLTSMSAECLRTSDLVENKSIHGGEIITVCGYYVLDEESSVLYYDKFSYKDKSFRYAIWIGVGDSFLEKEFKGRKKRGMVKLRGRYAARNLGMFEMYKGRIDDISVFERIE